MRAEIHIRNFSKLATKKLLSLLHEAYLKDFVVRFLLISSLLLGVVVWLISLVSFQPSEFLIPLRYNSFLGVSELGQWYQIYWIPFVLTVCVTLNAFLGNIVFKKDKMISYILLGSNVFLSVLALTIIINLTLMMAK